MIFASRIAAGELSARVEEGNLDEISEVAHALDATASRLEQSFHALETNRRELEALLDSMQEAVVAVNAQGQVSWSNSVMQTHLAQPGARRTLAGAYHPRPGSARLRRRARSLTGRFIARAPLRSLLAASTRSAPRPPPAEAR